MSDIAKDYDPELAKKYHELAKRFAVSLPMLEISSTDLWKSACQDTPDQWVAKSIEGVKRVYARALMLG
jgi:hypothetical protein